MTDAEMKEVVAQVLEEVAKVARKSHVRPGASQAQPIDAEEFDRLLRVAAGKIRSGP
jgi:hypothetical protein